jgi:hypothetical protein
MMIQYGYEISIDEVKRIVRNNPKLQGTTFDGYSSHENEVLLGVVFMGYIFSKFQKRTISTNLFNMIYMGV